MSIQFEGVHGGALERLLVRKQEPIRAVATPFPGWNAVSGEEGGKLGPAKGWVVVLGAVTGAGKSYLALQLAAHAVQNGEKVGDVNFEMSFNGVSTRYLSLLSGVPKYRLEEGPHFRTEAWLEAKRVADATYRDDGGVLITNESTVFNINDIAESYEKLTDLGVSMIIVDYAQLITVPGRDDVYGRSEAVANELRRLTHKHGVLTIAVSQMRREAGQRSGLPTIYDLLGGGVWEQNANQIWLINHQLNFEFGHNERGQPQGRFTELICGKNRHGFSPTLRIMQEFETMKFSEVVNPSDLTVDHPFMDHGEQVITVDVDNQRYSNRTGSLFEDDDDV